MIGWIALAGIIVRNSILLVDFSVHQIQQGTSVVESVIMACKTRTRPIMITALALVCGSSVIFFDPIFQGMAISLASGVLVSTVLTLIVIPLGCISASKDLLEVAAATAPGGKLPAHPKPAQPQPEQPQPAAEDSATQASSSRGEPVSDKRRPSLPARIWGSLLSLVTMVFYLLRGLFLLLFQGLGRLAKGRSRGKSKEIPPATGGAGGEGPSGPPPTPAQGGAPSEAPPSVAAQSPTAATGVPVVSEQTAASLSDVSVEAGAEEQAREDEVKLEKQEEQTHQAQESAKPATRQQAAKAKKRPSAVKKQAKKKAASAKAKKASAKTTPVTKNATTGNSGEQNDERELEEVESRKLASSVAPLPVRKRSARRGIRLK
jgi:hypothetical protein